MANTQISNLAIERLIALKLSGKSKKYQKGVEDSLWMLRDLFQTLNIPTNN